MQIVGYQAHETDEAGNLNSAQFQTFKAKPKRKKQLYNSITKNCLEMSLYETSTTHYCMSEIQEEKLTFDYFKEGINMYIDKDELEATTSDNLIKIIDLFNSLKKRN